MPSTELDRVSTALREHGYQSQSYNILTADKRYFFPKTVPGAAVAYVVVAGVALAAGDPLCREKDIRDVCADFLAFCQENGWRCAFQAVMLRTLEQLQFIGFGFMKIGEEPFFKLADFALEGGKFRDLRRDVRRAQADGMTIVEYRPKERRDLAIEREMNELSRTWAEKKGSGEFGFLVGTPDLAEPGDRKYFLAMLNGHVEAFCVCTPIYARNGVYFDLLRRKDRPVRGTVELLIIDSFRQLKEQGYELATLGTAPLSGEHAEEPVQGWFIELAMDIAFSRLGYFYSFKPIYEFKEQFGPDFWESRYLAYHPARFNPVVIYALLTAYDPAAVRNLSLKQLAAAWDGVVSLAGTPVDVAEWAARLPAETARGVLKLISHVPRPGMPPLPGLPSLSRLPGVDLLMDTPHAVNRLRQMAGMGGGGPDRENPPDETAVKR
jgi:phosphatidylglycerol lysyltransferase